MVCLSTLQTNDITIHKYEFPLAYLDNGNKLRELQPASIKPYRIQFSTAMPGLF